MFTSSRWLPGLVVLFLIGCGDPLPVVDEQTPPTSASEMTGWLEERFYARWACEPRADPSDESSPHGKNRICSNTLLSESESGEYPVGASNVKEFLDDEGNVTGHAVFLRVRPGAAGSNWYWYEGSGNTVFAAGLGVSSCLSCHSGASRDVVFTRVR